MSRKDFPSFFSDFPPEINEIDLSVPQELLNHLTELHEMPHVEFQWITMWEKDIKELFCQRIGFAAGLEWFVHTRIDNPSSDNTWWKHKVVEKVCLDNPNHQVFWLDDEMLDEPFEELTQSLSTNHSNLTNFACNSSTGLTRSDILAIGNSIRNEKFFNLTIEAL